MTVTQAENPETEAETGIDAHAHAHAQGGHGGPTHTHVVHAVLEDVGPCKKLLKVAVGKDEVARELEERIEHVRRTINVKGFRKGKVPRKYVEKNYRAAIEEDVRKHLLEHSYFEALKEKGVESAQILGESKVDKLKFSAEEGLSFEVTLQVRPTFQLPDYKGIAVEVARVRVPDEDVARELENFRKSRGEIRPVEEASAVVEPEDTLTCDVEVWLADEYESFAEEQEAKKSGKSKEKEGAKKDLDDDDEGPLKPLKTHQDVEVRLADAQEGATVEVAGVEVEDLGDALVGLKIAEWGEAETQLPVDYEVSEGRNEAAVLRVKVNSIKRLFLPPLTDEWAKSAGHDTVEDLRREVRESLFRARELRREDEVETKVLDSVLHSVGAFPLPEDLIASELRDAQRRREVELRLQENKSEEEAKRTVAQEEAESRAEVERSLRTFFVVDEIARREKIRVNEPDVDGRIARIAAASGKHPGEVRKYLEDRGVLPQLRHEILNEKARGFLREHAKVTETED